MTNRQINITTGLTLGLAYASAVWVGTGDATAVLVGLGSYAVFVLTDRNTWKP